MVPTELEKRPLAACLRLVLPATHPVQFQMVHNNLVLLQTFTTNRMRANELTEPTEEVILLSQ